MMTRTPPEQTNGMQPQSLAWAEPPCPSWGVPIPPKVQETCDAIVRRLGGRQSERGKRFEACYLNTLQTTVTKLDGWNFKGAKPPPEGSYFILTGDIGDMWLRDSACQVNQYLPLVADDAQLRTIIEGLIRLQAFFIKEYPWAHSFHGPWVKDATSWDIDDKYELDSPCYFLWLVHSYYSHVQEKATKGFFEGLAPTVASILSQWEALQGGERPPTPDDPTYFKDWGAMVPEVPLVPTLCRPSDDYSKFPYLIPANMFVVSVLDQVRSMLDDGLWTGSVVDASLVKALSASIRQAISDYGIVKRLDGSRIYAYEVSGEIPSPTLNGDESNDSKVLSAVNLMDDAGVPSLLSGPYIGFRNADDPDGAIEASTRSFVLSTPKGLVPGRETLNGGKPLSPEHALGNVWFSTGKEREGPGSWHTREWGPGYTDGKGGVWPMALIIAAITEMPSGQKLGDSTASNIRKQIQVIDGTAFMVKPGQGYIHESVSPNVDPRTRYTRPWFAWANSLYSELIIKYIDVIAEPTDLEHAQPRQQSV